MIRSVLKRLIGNDPPPSQYPDWNAILDGSRAAWDAARRRATGPHVLIATSSGGLPGSASVESVLAVALTLRGAQVHILLCDEALPACHLTTIDRFQDAGDFVEHGPPNGLCSSCYGKGRKLFDPLGLPVHRYSDLVTEEEAAEARREALAAPLDHLADYRWEGLAVGEHALAGALRFVTRGDFDGEPHAEGILRRYVEGGLRSAYAVRRLLRSGPFEHAVFHHGIYVPQGVIGEVARSEDVHVVNWMVGYRNRCFNFSHDESYHLTLLDEPIDLWEGLDLRPDMEADIVDYLESRARGTNDWVKFNDRPHESVDYIQDQLDLDPDRPWVSLLTNILWDAQLHFEHNAFSGMREWVMESIRYFAQRPDLQLVIRVHPGEVRDTLVSRQPILDEIALEFPELPDNVRLVPPDSRISTYALAQASDAAVIYGTKMGVELSALGVPVIVAGEAWVRNKGITYDAGSKAEYLALLDRLPLGGRLSGDALARARRYAYHFFFRRMIPWEFMEPTGRRPPFRVAIDGVEALGPGRDAGLDLVCDGILNGGEFIYPAEGVGERAAVSVDS